MSALTNLCRSRGTFAVLAIAAAVAGCQPSVEEQAAAAKATGRRATTTPSTHFRRLPSRCAIADA